jgi:hypothetical protein
MMRFSRVGFVVLVMLLVTGCSAASQPTATPVPNAEAMLDKAATEIRNAQSFKIKLQVAGAPAYIDAVVMPGGSTNSIAFVSTDGSYSAPDKVSARVIANLMGIPGKVDIVAIGMDQYINSPLLTAGNWTQQVFSPDFNAEKLIASDTGIAATIKALKGFTVSGPEAVDGTPMYRLKGKATSAEITALTIGLISGKDVELEIFIAVETGRIDHVVIVQPGTETKTDPQPTTWTLELFDYNVAVTITPPPSVEQAPASTQASSDAPTGQPALDVTAAATAAQ